MTVTATLKAIIAAPTLGSAVDLVPADWSLTIVGPDAMGCHASLTPPNPPAACVRMNERGLVPGKGDTRIEALRDGAAWLLRIIERQESVQA